MLGNYREFRPGQSPFCSLDNEIANAIEADPALIEAYPWRLHAAACKGFDRLAAWLLDHGSDVNSLRGDRAPLDVAAECAPYSSLNRAREMMIWLREHGAELTPRAAVALGEAEWLRARHAEADWRIQVESKCSSVLGLPGDTFTGSIRCRSCHQLEYAEWAKLAW